jgi:hypothetical protein
VITSADGLFLLLLLQFDFFAGSIFPVFLSTAAGLGLGLARFATLSLFVVSVFVGDESR